MSPVIDLAFLVGKVNRPGIAHRLPPEQVRAAAIVPL
jgi:hypothetical protein